MFALVESIIKPHMLHFGDPSLSFQNCNQLFKIGFILVVYENAVHLIDNF